MNLFSGKLTNRVIITLPLTGLPEARFSFFFFRTQTQTAVPFPVLLLLVSNYPCDGVNHFRDVLVFKNYREKMENDHVPFIRASVRRKGRKHTHTPRARNAYETKTEQRISTCFIDNPYYTNPKDYTYNIYIYKKCISKYSPVWGIRCRQRIIKGHFREVQNVIFLLL